MIFFYILNFDYKGRTDFILHFWFKTIIILSPKRNRKINCKHRVLDTLNNYYDLIQLTINYKKNKFFTKKREINISSRLYSK